MEELMDVVLQGLGSIVVFLIAACFRALLRKMKIAITAEQEDRLFKVITQLAHGAEEAAARASRDGEPRVDKRQYVLDAAEKHPEVPADAKPRLENMVDVCLARTPGAGATGAKSFKDGE